MIVRKPEAERRLGKKLKGRKRDWYLLSKDGTRNLGGPYTSRREALDREKAVQYFKHARPNPGGRRVAWTPSTFEMYYFRESGLEPGDLGTVVGNSGDPENDVVVDWDNKGEIAVPSKALRNASARNPKKKKKRKKKKPQLPALRKKVEEVEVTPIPAEMEAFAKHVPVVPPQPAAPAGRTELLPPQKPMDKLITGRSEVPQAFEKEDPETQRALLEMMRKGAKEREKLMKEWEQKKRREQGLAPNRFVTSSAGNPAVHPMALEMRERYLADRSAGHHDAAEYWRGQAAAYFTGNPLYTDYELEGVTIRMDDNYQVMWMSDWDRVWEFVQKGYFTPIGRGPATYGDVAFYYTYRAPKAAQNSMVRSAAGNPSGRYRVSVYSRMSPYWRHWVTADTMQRVVDYVLEVENSRLNRGEEPDVQFYVEDTLLGDPGATYNVSIRHGMDDFRHWQDFRGHDQTLSKCIGANRYSFANLGYPMDFLIQEVTGPRRGTLRYNRDVVSAAGNPQWVRDFRENPSKEPGAWQRIAEGVAVAGLSAIGLAALGFSPNPARFTLEQARRELRKLGYLIKKGRGRKEKDVFLRSSRYVIMPMSFGGMKIGARNLDAVSEFIHIIKRGIPKFIQPNMAAKLKTIRKTSKKYERKAPAAPAAPEEAVMEDPVFSIYDRWLSVQEAAAYFGVERYTIYRWIKGENLPPNCKMPAHRVGRLWKFRLAELEAWVKRCWGKSGIS